MEKYKCLSNIVELTDEEVREALELSVSLVKEQLPEFTEYFPAAASKDNFYPKTANDDWTNGFWTGELWLAYEQSGDESLRTAALQQVDSYLDRIHKRVVVDHHDMGFLYTPSCVAAYRLTGSEIGKEAALLASDNLLGRFQENGAFFQAWGDLKDDSQYRLIIDCLLNMPLLFWATEVTGKETYKEYAVRHITTAMKHVIREDNSTYHTYYFDRATGASVKGVTAQGYRDGSAWARGQAWGIYGAALSYRFLKEEEYITIYRKLTDFFLEHLPVDGIAYWDFDFTDGSSEPRDSSAVAIAVCGMLEMAKYMEPKEAEETVRNARKLLKALYEQCAVKSSAESNGILLHATYAKSSPHNSCNNNGVDECNIWGDYFYMEALTRLAKDWEVYW